MLQQHTSLAKANEALARAHSKEVREQRTMKTLEQALVRKGAVALTSAGYGAMDLFNVPHEVKGFPWKLAVWVAATATEAMSKGAVQQAAGGLGDITLGLFIHGAVKNKTFIAGSGGKSGGGF